MAKKSVKITGLGDAIAQELTVYHTNVTEKVGNLAETAVKALVKKTKATAPVATGSFQKNIASKRLDGGRLGAQTFVWYVKPPDHRVTHLLAHGHATVDGGRVAGNPFLQNAVDEVLPEYEKAVEEAIKNGK